MRFAFFYDQVVTYGDWTEQRVTAATAAGGQPDFTFAAHTIRRGSRQREIGDTVVWLGRKVLVISTKSRDPEAGQNDTPERAFSWLDRTIEAACRQIDGVVRALSTAAAGEIELESERGVVVPWDPSMVDEYFGLVIVNYAAPEDYVPVVTASTPTVVQQARDWEFILNEIRTTTGLFTYLEQRLGLNLNQPFGTEKEVLSLIGIAEHQGGLLVIGAEGAAIPTGTFDRLRRQYPEAELGFDPDDRLGFVIDAMISQAHDMDPDLTDMRWVHDYLRTIEVLDSIPRRSRTPIGRKVFEKAALAREEGRPRYFVVAALGGLGRVLFIFHPGDRDERREFLRFLTTLFHAKYLSMAPSPLIAVTLGVATEPFPNAGRSHDYMFCGGELWDSSEDFPRQRDELYAEYFSSEPT